MGFIQGLLTVLATLWFLFKSWLFIFISPIKNPVILWIIIPIWVNWFFAEFFQEKKRTSLGNAITNGAVMTWVGIDWIRYLVAQLTAGGLKFSFTLISLFLICAFVFAIGIFIIIQGIHGKRYISFVGRVREVTYLMVMFSPIIYGIIELNIKNLAAIILFFPLFYFVIELIDHYLPSPKSIAEEEGLPRGGEDFSALPELPESKLSELK